MLDSGINFQSPWSIEGCKALALTPSIFTGRTNSFAENGRFAIPEFRHFARRASRNPLAYGNASFDDNRRSRRGVIALRDLWPIVSKIAGELALSFDGSFAKRSAVQSSMSMWRPHFQC
jgi:hypothetical protein